MSDTKKDTLSLSLSLGDSNFRSIISSFFKNEHHTFVVQKTEKLASAIYLVTGHMSQEEPIRTRLRTCVLALVSSSAGEFDERGHEDFGSRCLEVASILRLAERAHLVSSMNAKILCEEYAHLAAFVREHKEKIFGNTLDVVVKRPSPPAHSLAKSMGGDAHFIKDNSHIGSKRHSERQKKIIDLLSKKDKITVKEASETIEGCSEKTIQREIMSLVHDGVLIKEGERRWSTYRLAVAQ